MYHLGWFLGNGYGIQNWEGVLNVPWSGHHMTDWMKPDLYCDLAASLERAGFDYILLEDTAMIEDTYKGSAEATMRRGILAPKSDPVALVPYMSMRTKHIGVISTVSVIQYPPYLATRLFNSLNHLTEGRVGMNIVTSVTDRVAQNFGYDQHLDHDERYVMATEWAEISQRLQSCWEPDAVIADYENEFYADYTKIHTIDYKGKYFSCRGPINSPMGPQCPMPVASAGNSIPGREFAARFADTLLVAATSVEDMKKVRQDMHERLRRHGRDPGQFKMLFIAVPTISWSDEDARTQYAAQQRAKWSDSHIEFSLWYMSYVSGGRIDSANTT